MMTRSDEIRRNDPTSPHKNILYRAIKESTYLVAKPLLTATSIHRFHTVGYLVFSVGLLAGVLGASAVGYDWLLLKDSALVSYLIRQVATGFGVEDPIRVGLPIPLSATLILLVGYFTGPIRRLVGGATIEGVLWLLQKIVGLGEICMDHRSGSLALMAVLIAGVSGGMMWIWADTSQTALLRQDYEVWFTSVEDFVMTTSLTRPEPSRLSGLAALWRDGFVKILPSSDGSDHPALRLRNLLRAIHEKDGESAASWPDHLQNEVDDFVASPANITAPAHPTVARAAATFALAQIVLGRAYMRLARDDCSDRVQISRGYRFFFEVKPSQYPAERANGLGTAYTCAFFAYQESRQRGGTRAETDPALDSICAGIGQCIARAHDSYSNAAREAIPCGYVDQRRRNNLADLLIRIATDYSLLRQDLRSLPELYRFSTATALRGELDRAMVDVLACASSSHFIPTIFVTAAQAYGVATGLTVSPLPEDLRNAGLYLRMAHGFLPGSLPEWNLEYFCGCLDPERGFLPEFEAGFFDTHAGSIVYDRALLEALLRQECGIEE